jgi:hypothetical protein
MIKKRYGRIICCKSCGKESVNCGYFLCLKCYTKNYKKEHPDVMERMDKRAKERWKEKWRTDSVFREKVNQKQKKWRSNPENKEKILKYQREYNKTHPRFNKKRVGYLCECGTIDKGRTSNLPNNPHSTQYKCPNCGRFSQKIRVVYNRFTGKVIEDAD